MKLSNKVKFDEFIKCLEDQKDIVIATENDIKLCIVYQEQSTDIVTFNRDYLVRIKDNKKVSIEQIALGISKKFDASVENYIDSLLHILFSGLMITYSGIHDEIYIFDISKVQSRGTEESSSEPSSSYRSKDGFVENYKDNIMLLRTRLKSSNLEIEEFALGERSKTTVCLLSVSDIHNDEIKKEIIKQLKDIKIDAVLQHEDISNCFQGDKKMPVFLYIGSPDLACYHLLQGQFLILIDRIPTLMVIPTTFAFYTKLRIDSVNIKAFAIFERFFVLFSLVLSIFFLGLLCSFLTNQSDSLSLDLLSTFKVTQKGVLLPLYYEIFFVLLVFEVFYYIIYRSAMITMSSMIVLVGGLLIGQNAIESGLTGVLVLTLTGISFLSTFIVSSNVTLSMSISIVRILLILFSMFFGLFGFTIGMIIVLYMMYTEETCGVPFFYPFMPIDFKEIKEYFVSPSDNKINERSSIFRVKDKTNKVKK